jgi:hypothetical protein
MKIQNGILIEVLETDLVNGEFINNEIIAIGDKCFYEFKSLIKIECKKVTTVGNDSFRSNDALVSCDMPALTTVGNYSFSSNDALVSCNMPALTTVGNDSFRSNDALVSCDMPALTTVGNYSFRYNDALVSCNMPALTTVGNDSFRSNDALVSCDMPALTTVGNYSFRYNDALVSLKLGQRKLKIKTVDGYCFVIENEKTTKGIKVYKGYNFNLMLNNIINKTDSFVAEKDGFTAHGKTIKQAINDLQFKCIAEKLKKEPIKKDTLITSQYYRIITGACEFGVKDWMNRNNMTKESYRADELFPILESTSAYGFERFKSLITW